MSGVTRLLRLPAVKERVGLSRSSIYAMEAKGQFPQRVRIGPKAVAWNASDVDQWFASRVTVGAGSRGELQ